MRWSLLKKPGNLSAEDKQVLAELEREDEGFVHSFRVIIRSLVSIFDHAHSEAQAKLRLHQLRKDIHALEDRHLNKIPQFFDEHWEQALRFYGKRAWAPIGVGPTPSRGCGCCAGWRKTMMGSGLAATRQHSIQIYQAMKYLSLDIADFIEQGPQLAELPSV